MGAVRPLRELLPPGSKVACPREVARSVSYQGFEVIDFDVVSTAEVVDARRVNGADPDLGRGALDRLSIARWKGATHLLLPGVTKDWYRTHPHLRRYLQGLCESSGTSVVGMSWALPPLPPPGDPKVFCIGLTKTGTSSLHRALDILGLRSVHWGGSDGFQAVLQASRHGEPLLSRLGDDDDAYLDIEALSVRFDLLDLQYPGSRFIVTVRDVDDWIASRRRHVERNRRDLGRGRYVGANLEVSEAEWKEIWHTHIYRTATYFQGRADCLSLDLCDSPRWDELAAFLDRPIPSVPFPAENVDGRPGRSRYPSFAAPTADDAGFDAFDEGEGECTVCGAIANTFAPSGTAMDRPEARCPECGSLERHRAAWVFFTDRTNLLTDPLDVLHIAPEPFLADRLSRQDNLRYQRVGFEPTGPLVRTNNIEVPEGGFDVVLASHLLQCIPDDQEALRLLATLVRPGGWALVTVPMWGPTTREDPSVHGADERRERYGDPRHVRMYGNDGVFEQRLRDAGFSVAIEDVAANLGPVERHRYRLGRAEPMHWCTRLDTAAMRR